MHIFRKTESCFNFAAFSLILCSGLAAAERVGEFCPSCDNPAAAQALAESLAPPPQSGPGCGGLIPLGEQVHESGSAESAASCATGMRRVFILNHLTGDAYVFEVWMENSIPNAQAVLMSWEEQIIVDHVLQLRLAWDDLLQGVSFGGDLGLGFEGISPRMSTTNVPSGCPTGTALDVYLDPAALTALTSLVQTQAELRLPEFRFGQSWINRLRGVGASAFGVGFNVAWERNLTPSMVYIAEFNVSEDPSPLLPDRLAFDLELVTNAAPSGRPIVRTSFNEEASRVAGLPLQALRTGGDVGECAAAKIGRAFEELGYTFHIPPSDPTPSPFPTVLLPPGSGFSFCTARVGVRIDGVHAYSIRIAVPCS